MKNNYSQEFDALQFASGYCAVLANCVVDAGKTWGGPASEITSAGEKISKESAGVRHACGASDLDCEMYASTRRSIAEQIVSHPPLRDQSVRLVCEIKFITPEYYEMRKSTHAWYKIARVEHAWSMVLDYLGGLDDD